MIPTRGAKLKPIAWPLRMGLFALMFVGVLTIGTRVYDVGRQVVVGGNPEVVTPLLAAEEVKKEEAKHEEPKHEEKKPEEKKEEAKSAETKPDEHAKADEKKEEGKKPEEKAETPAPNPDLQVDDPNFDPPELTESEINVLRHLSDRRKTLEKRAKELDQRETLLNLSEQRVDKKLVELKQMQDEIRKTLGQADADYKKQVASMVKIYETMKPKDAAKIFGTMEMPTLIEVMSRMKEAKAAPVLAAMDAAKAKELSTQLMAKKNLPPAP
jgi:flagellar motility protein MotE (MotC chaperone)